MSVIQHSEALYLPRANPVRDIYSVNISVMTRAVKIIIF